MIGFTKTKQSPFYFITIKIIMSSSPEKKDPLLSPKSSLIDYMRVYTYAHHTYQQLSCLFDPLLTKLYAISSDVRIGKISPEQGVEMIRKIENTIKNTVESIYQTLGIELPHAPQKQEPPFLGGWGF